MIIAEVHSIKISDLKALINNFSGSLAEYVIYYYFVVSEHIHIGQKYLNISFF
jgi:hypothetical protein